MYEEYFGLKKKPFSIVPDPRYFFMSSGHSEALAHLLYGIRSEGGFVLLTGEVGAGKTTVCRRLLELVPSDIEVAFILNPKQTSEELLANVCDEFGIGYPENTGSIKVLVSRINDYLLDLHEKGRRAVLIIEEAQNLSPDVLEQIRLLTNLETHEQKLLQIILLGQPEFRDMLSRPELVQLSQRITARYHLGPLNEEETVAYVNHRLSVAGLARGQLFPPATIKKLYRLTGGVPRLINVTCDRALLGVFTQEKERVDMKTLRAAAREVSGENGDKPEKKVISYVMAAVLLIVFTSVLGIFYLERPGPAQKEELSVPEEKSALPAKENPVKNLLVLPPDLTGASSREMAYSDLFGRWGIPYKAGDPGTVCDQAGRHGLECVQGKGNMHDLYQMNRPAVLTFVDEKSEYYATLTELKGEKAVFAVGAETKRVAAGEIIERWSGDYLLLWKPPVDYKERLKPGSRGPAVAWLEAQLAVARGRVGTVGTKQVYDNEITREVKKFQVSAGLMPDGIAGPRTLLRLISATGNGGPVLTLKGRE
jgi:general secretion pathway protein A